MNKHIDHLIADYLDGRLSPRQAAAIRHHLTGCPACAAELARQERLRADLRLVLGHSTAPNRQEIEQWWGQISHKTRRPTRYLAASMAIPMLVSLLVIIFPIAAGLGSIPVSHAAQESSSTAALPYANIPDVQGVQIDGTSVIRQAAPPVTVAQPIATPALNEDAYLAASPVPPAPAAP